MPNLLHYPDRAQLMRDLAERVADQLRDVLAAQPSATLVVPGGTTPGPFFAALSKADLDWPRVRVMLSDERFVPESSDRSNTALIRRLLLQSNAENAQFVPITALGSAPEDVIDALRERIEAALPIDVLVLGMGADMHTASLFPGADQLAAALADDAPSLMAMRAPGAPEPRLTLTAPVLRGAKNIHLLLTGAEKKTALAEALLEGPVIDAPVRAILGAPNPVVIHYAD
ncbi:6-phosphogluconolactonase [Abyssibius alkaniclasticus]|uniref:6-phosphogluconolactonase n=1 Tax=Abyssibius alkaniclasticus TaxID=2881234 RepID=UPI00405A450B